MLGAPEHDVAVARAFLRRPDLFVRRVLDVQPEPWQIEALEALAAGRSVAIRSGHGVGKSALLSWGILWWLATHPDALVPCTAPTGHQLRDVLWTELARWLQRSPLRDILEWSPTAVRFRAAPERWFAVARTSAKPENLAGFHARHLLYVVDEASGVADATMAVVDGALTTPGALVLLAGNPTRPSGYFADAFAKNRWAWQAIHVSSEQSGRVDPAWVAAMARKWGADSDVYRVRVQGEFPRTDARGFIGLDLVERAVRPLAREAAPAVATTGDLCVGVDVARYGDSETAIVARRGRHMVGLETTRGRSTQEVAGLALATARELLARFAPGGPVRIVVDDTGVGGGVTDALQAAVADAARWDGPRIDVTPFSFGSGGDAHYHDAASRLWGAVRDRLAYTDDDGEPGLTLLPDDDLLGQLTAREYALTPAGKIRLERKEDLRRRKQPSPDRADALALACLPLVGIKREEDESVLDLLRSATIYG